MPECVDEIVPDCLHYFGVDPWDLPAHRAIQLVASLPLFWTVIPDTDPPMWRSAVRPRIEKLAERARMNDESSLVDHATGDDAQLFAELGIAPRKG